MKFKDSDFEIITQDPGYVGGLKMIEKIGRTCYQSDDKITENSYLDFVERMRKSKHYAMLEFFTVYLKLKNDKEEEIKFYTENPYSKLVRKDDSVLVTTNYRVLVENSRESDLTYFCPSPEPEHPKRLTIKLFISRGISHESVRHRVGSFAQSSQRYICYAKEKFGGEITYIIPSVIYKIRDRLSKTIDPLTKESREYLKNLTGEELVNQLICLDRGVSTWYNVLEKIENDYKYLILEEDWKAQEARGILCNDTSTVLNICMFTEDWKHYLDLRALGTTGAPHPDMKRISEKILDKLILDEVFTINDKGELCLK